MRGLQQAKSPIRDNINPARNIFFVNDAAILLITFFLTVLIDLIVAIEIGKVLASFLFMRSMIKFSELNILTGHKSKAAVLQTYEIKSPPSLKLWRAKWR